MPIYLLSVIQEWQYDAFDSKVVRAKNEKEARELANEDIGAEGKTWTSPYSVTCEEIGEGDSEVILASFNAG